MPRNPAGDMLTNPDIHGNKGEKKWGYMRVKKFLFLICFCFLFCYSARLWPCYMQLLLTFIVVKGSIFKILRVLFIQISALWRLSLAVLQKCKSSVIPCNYRIRLQTNKHFTLCLASHMVSKLSISVASAGTQAGHKVRHRLKTPVKQKHQRFPTALDSRHLLERASPQLLPR